LAARKRGAFTVGLIGAKGDIGDMVDICLRVPSQVTARIQEAHILLGHILCDWIEAELCVTSV
jgi:D-sedoheptulose 7-phosphate isomerase